VALNLNIGTSAALDKAVLATGPEWVLFPLGLRRLDNLHVATQARRVGVGLGKLAVESDWVVSWELGEYAGNCVADGAGVSGLHELFETGAPSSSI
jgi:hypothetical protein